MADATATDLAEELHALLRDRGERVGCAESLTGGELATLLSGTPGASATFVGGVVSYATSVKRELLGVTAPQVVSATCAEQMADGVRRLLHVDWALATTGVAGPDRQEDQAAGTVFVGLAGPGTPAAALALRLDGGRSAIRSATCRAALEELVQAVRGG